MRPKSQLEISLMREGGKKLGKILNELAGEVAPGMTTKQLAGSAAQKIKEEGLEAILLGYQGFPDVICISVNEEVVHGIPSKRVIKDGDIVKLDLSVANQGMVLDSAVTVIAGSSTSAEHAKLIKYTKLALDKGISAIRGDGTKTGDIGSAVQKELESHGLGVVRDLVGHGVGFSLHEGLEIPNYGVAGSGKALKAGDTIAVEPMATLGDWRVGMLKDGWTVVSRDGSLAAHFEHTILVTDDGAEILTSPELRKAEH